jgi:hypothetical protein
MICTAMGDATAEQYDNGAEVFAMAPGGLGAVEDWDISHYFGASPSIEIKKFTIGAEDDTAPGPYIPVGTPIWWEYIVTNNGDVALANVTVTDSDPEVIISCGNTTLEPGQTMECWADGIATAGQYSNTAIATGDPPGGLGTVAADDAGHYFGGNASIKIEKYTNSQDADTPPGPYILVGDEVVWQYTVTNTGNVDLGNLTVKDGKGVSIYCPTDTLPASESITCEANGTAEADQHVNTAEVFAKAPGDLGDVEDWDASHYFGASPSIDIEKYTMGIDADTAPGPYVPVGNPVVWEYVVTNTGDVPLANVTVSDSALDVFISCPWSTLNPGESMVCEFFGTAVAGQYVNAGNATGIPPGGLDPVYDIDISHYFGGTPLPAIAYDPPAFHFRTREGSGRILEKALVMENAGETGCAQLNWFLSDNAPWLTLSPASGSTACGGYDTVAVLVDTSGMSADTHYAIITIEAPGAANTPQQIEVVLSIRPGR